MPPPPPKRRSSLSIINFRPKSFIKNKDINLVASPNPAKNKDDMASRPKPHRTHAPPLSAAFAHAQARPVFKQPSSQNVLKTVLEPSIPEIQVPEVSNSQTNPVISNNEPAISNSQTKPVIILPIYVEETLAETHPQMKVVLNNQQK